MSALGVLTVAGALAACGGGRPGAAAVVDGRSIPTADVQDATRELADVLQGVSSSAILGVLVQEPTVRALTEEAGVAVGEDTAADALAEQAEVVGAAGQEFSPASVTVMRYLLEIEALQGASDAEVLLATLQEDLGALDLTVNPRFGTADEVGTVGATSYPWLVSADGADATPAP
ncbi:hypothetical protein [Cellulomonas pakistanensis]|uniref:Uncharacterized protein n=1 Tax=Cellulomonas pakistanensis TaxID=992287 RepID=A0A919U3S1_9CELL|nr:hypothetical protein [Cellulomonas pakistanensis]GIG36626.1 hypothetical protein Cpa01nite_20070 [Cellulomonas pakistanensis]